MKQESKQSIGDVMRFNSGETKPEHFYRNEIQFPILGNMEKAMILIVNKVKSWERQGNTFTFQTEGVFYQKRFFYRFLDYRATYDLMDRTRNICVKLTLCSDRIVRIQAQQGHTVDDRTSEMLVQDFSAETMLRIEEDEKELRIHTNAICIKVQKEPWNVVISDRNGRDLFRQYTSSRTNAHPVMKYEQCPFGFLYDQKTGKTYTSEQIEFSDDEHFYGFGEKFTDLDKRGQSVDLWNTNCLSCNTVRSYKNIPFFMSTKGYGIFMHTSNAINCNMGQHYNKAYSMLTDDSVIDYFFIYGPSMKEILPQYTNLTGKTPLPPKWSYGFWISKISYRSQAEVEELIETFRTKEIPCDVIHLDTDWYEYNWVCDYQFSTTRFDDAKKMIDHAREKGFHITLWQMPYIETNHEHPNPVFIEGMENGYFASRNDGSNDFQHGLIDFSNPEAIDWYKNKLLRPLLEMGIDAIKVDFGESAPPFYQYAGVSSDKMHNLYSLLYNKTVFEITKEVRGEGIIWARSAWAGSQRYPLHWGGDCDVDFHGLVTTVKAGLSFGLSGFPFWSHDIGGFNMPTTPEVYARWMQVGCFTSHSRAHGVKTREPWDFGEEVEQIAKKYLNLRYQLLPYIYSQSYQCTVTSLPMFRALLLEYQSDRNVWGIDNQYLFGESFMVAPIMDSTNERDVYLPEGRWTDYWTKEQIMGGKWIHICAPLDTLPLYVRENAIIPFGPVQNYVDEIALEEVTWDLYPETGTAVFELYENEEIITVLSMKCDSGKLEIEIKNNRRKNVFKLNHIKPSQLCVNGESVPYEDKDGITIFRTEKADLETLFITVFI